MDKKSKTNASNENSTLGEIVGLVKNLITSSVLLFFWEGIDRVKRKIQINVQIGIKILVGLISIIIGLIFLLTGIARLLDQVVEMPEGTGQVIVGAFVVITGMILIDRTKNKKNE